MGKYDLDILGNAIDSLNESLAKYAQGQDGSLKSHKFAILHFCHFMELTLKYHISKINDFLIYSEVFKVVEKKAKANGLSLIDSYKALVAEGFDFEAPIRTCTNPHTITLEKALAYVESDKEYFDSDLAREIRAIKNLRNDIEHHKFVINTKDVRLIIGRLTRGFDEFTEVFNVIGLKDAIDKEHLAVFQTLADEYEHDLQEAKIDVRESHDAAFKGVRPKHYYDIHWAAYDCPECNVSNLMIPDDSSSTGFKCTMCGNEKSDDIEVDCEICGETWPKGSMSRWDGTYDYTCPHCNDFESKF